MLRVEIVIFVVVVVPSFILIDSIELNEHQCDDTHTHTMTLAHNQSSLNMFNKLQTYFHHFYPA